MVDLNESWVTGNTGHTAEHNSISLKVNKAVRQLTPGTDGQVLTSNAASSDGMHWVSPAAADSTIIASQGWVTLDSFDTGGLTDDQMLTAALSYAAAQTYVPAIRFTNRLYTFATANRAPFDGLSLVGPPGSGNVELNSSTKTKSRQHLTMTGSWFTMDGSASRYSCSFENLALTGGSNATFLGQGSASGVWRNLNIRNITANNMRSLIGTQSTKLLVTSPIFNGWWEINGMYNGHVHIGGSCESILWPDGGIFDNGGQAYNDAGGSTGQATIWLDYLEQANVGPIFLTCEDGWTGVRVDGPAYNGSGGSSNSGGPIRFWGTTIEGRNASQPCWGSLVRVLGGIVQLNHVGLLHAMSNPAAMGHSPQDGGGVDIQNGSLVHMNGCGWDRYTGQAETSPLAIVRSGSKLVIRDQFVTVKGGIWTGLPRVLNSGGTVSADSSVTVI